MAFSADAILRGVRAYYDNPTAKRDYRAQLRGNKALWLWSAYLVLLFLIAYFVYEGIQQNGAAMSIAQVQLQLQSFYQTMMIWMAVIVCLITPALTAGTIPVERQRRSLDLLFSAPVSMKGLLVGKMISSYRYLWMLLALSLPITSLCVVMGGATWYDVLASYAMLSFSGIVMTSLGLLISSMTTTIAAAVLWTYVSVAGYLILTAMLCASAIGIMLMLDPTVAPWYIGLNPFTVPYAGPTHSIIMGHNLPNWIPACFLALLISRLALLGAGSALSFHQAPETKKLRINGLVYLFGACTAGCYALNNLSAGIRGPQLTAGFIGYITILFFIFMPYLYSYGDDAGRKYRNDGRFELKNILWSNPSGSLPFTFALWIAIAGGAILGHFLAVTTGLPMTAGAFGTFPGGTSLPSPPLLPFYLAFWSLAYFFMWWCIGRAISSRTTSLRAARAGFIGSMIIIIALPVPILSLINTAMATDYTYHAVGGAAILHIFAPLSSEQLMEAAPIYALCMLVVGSLALALEKKKSVPPVVQHV